jgi:hypothetical protein
VRRTGNETVRRGRDITAAQLFQYSRGHASPDENKVRSWAMWP